MSQHILLKYRIVSIVHSSNQEVQHRICTRGLCQKLGAINLRVLANIVQFRYISNFLDMFDFVGTFLLVSCIMEMTDITVEPVISLVAWVVISLT